MKEKKAMADNILKKLAVGTAIGLAALSFYSKPAYSVPSYSISQDEIEEMIYSIGEEKTEETKPLPVSSETSAETITAPSLIPETKPLEITILETPALLETKPLESIIDTSLFRMTDTSAIPVSDSSIKFQTYSETPPRPPLPEPEYIFPIKFEESFPATCPSFIPEKKSFIPYQFPEIKPDTSTLFKTKPVLETILETPAMPETATIPETKAIPETPFYSFFEELLKSIETPETLPLKIPKIKFYVPGVELKYRLEKETETIKEKFEIQTSPLTIPMVPPPEPFETLITTEKEKKSEKIARKTERKGEIDASTMPAPILAYHHINDKYGRYSVTPENFRKHLESLWKDNFVTVDFQDYIKGDVFIPNGKKPVIITFDDGVQSQFNYKFDSSANTYVLDKDCAFAILEEFVKVHPDFGENAVFFINPADIPFGQEKFVKKKLEEVLAEGMEIGNHTFNHLNLSKAPDEKVIKEVGKAMEYFYNVLGNDAEKIKILATPFGVRLQNPKIIENFSYNGKNYQIVSVATCGDYELCPVPSGKKFNKFSIPRIETHNNDLDKIIGMADKSIQSLKLEFKVKEETQTLKEVKKETQPLRPQPLSVKQILAPIQKQEIDFEKYGKFDTSVAALTLEDKIKNFQFYSEESRFNFLKKYPKSPFAAKAAEELKENDMEAHNREIRDIYFDDTEGLWKADASPWLRYKYGFLKPAPVKHSPGHKDNGYYCAKFVQQTFYRHYSEDECRKLGIEGNLWDMLDYLRDNKEIIYERNIKTSKLCHDLIEKYPDKDYHEILAIMAKERKKTEQEVHAMLKPGDIIIAWNPYSLYKQHVDTHSAIYLGSGLIMQDWKESLEIMPLEELYKRIPGGIDAIARPNIPKKYYSIEIK